MSIIVRLPKRILYSLFTEDDSSALGLIKTTIASESASAFAIFYAELSPGRISRLPYHTLTPSDSKVLVSLEASASSRCE